MRIEARSAAVGSEPGRRRVGEVMDSSRWTGEAEMREGLAEHLRTEGKNLMSATCGDLKRGTPVYVDASADLYEVQRRMSLSHIRRIPVVAGGRLVGLLDLVDVALMEG